MPDAHVEDGSPFMPPYEGPTSNDVMDAVLASNIARRSSENMVSNTRDGICSISKRNIAGGIDLMILPLGDSITHGMGSTHGNGYRSSLHTLLQSNGNRVLFIGSQRMGSMTNNRHEGYPGNIIDQIAEKGADSARSQPNIILIHAGTNDMNGNTDVNNTPTRLRNLIHGYAVMAPSAAIIVAELIPALDTVRNGMRVVLVKMSEVLDGRLQDNPDIMDKLHPSDNGYRKMAIAWNAAIQDADSRKYVETAGAQTRACFSDPHWIDEGFQASGGDPVYGDGNFVANWIDMGVVASGACKGSEIRFIRLDDDKRLDYACIRSSSRVDVWINLPDPLRPGKVLWISQDGAAPGVERDGAGVFFADINGDGRDDYLWVSNTGDVDCWINTPGHDGLTWGWRFIGNIAGGVGATRATIRFTDIDGDGRADYSIIHPVTGSVTSWLNGGVGEKPVWRPLGVIAPGVSPPQEGFKVHLGCFTGSGRADYMWVNAQGQVTGYTNNRREGANLNPLWKPQGFIAVGVGEPREVVRLTDFDGDGMIDYLTVQRERGETRLWINGGSCGKYQAGDGIFLCDLNEDGREDYIWIDHNGIAWGYLNRLNEGRNMWTWEGILIVSIYDRKDIRMADLNNDGRCDFLFVDRKSGRTIMYENKGIVNGKWAFTSIGEVAFGVLEDIGPSFDWENVQFYDFDGDGFPDYSYTNQNGVTTVWLHSGKFPIVWSLPRIAASGVGVAGRDVRFADFNGDGLIDYMYVDRLTGSVEVWTPRGVQAVGVGSQGLSIKFADMLGNGRDGYLSIDPEAASIRFWRNNCQDPLPELPPIPETPTYSKCDKQFASEQEIEDDKNLPKHCVNLAIARVLHSHAENGLREYEELIANGYRSKFNLYFRYIRILAPGIIDSWMAEHASRVFTCYESRLQHCCSGCNSQTTCQGCGPDSTCGKYYEHKMDACPTSIPKDSAGAARPNEVRYQLNGKVEDFEKAIAEETGMSPNWWVFGKLFIYVYKIGATNVPPTCCPTCNEVDPSCTLHYHNYPIINPNFVVEDPREALEDSLPKMRQLLINLNDHIGQLYRHTYSGNTADVPEAVLVPINLITQGVHNMKAMVEASSEVAGVLKQQQISLIVTMVTALIGFVPFAGTAICAAGFNIIGKSVIMLGELTQVSLNLYALSTDPTHGANLLFVIIDLTSVFIPNFSQGAAAFKKARAEGKFQDVFNVVEAARLVQVSRIIVPSFYFGFG
ncbi:carbohydrate esterase family 3 protein [Cadophora sp. DSE1049]|nr:carbohydrate esterase family 3 protein [Cadophora sp. DSE1049]